MIASERPPSVLELVIASARGAGPDWCDVRHRVATSTATTLFAIIGRRAEVMLRVHSDDAGVVSRVESYAWDELGA